MRNTMIRILCLLWLLLLPTLAEAQTILNVPFVAARFVWDAPLPQPGPPTKHVVVCGDVSREVPMPATSILVSEVVPGPGVYDCTLYAENDFSRQTAPNVPFPSFRAGYAPNSAGGARLEVQ